MTTIQKWRSMPKLPLIRLSKMHLAHGNHRDRSNGLCILEAVAWVAGEEHSDHPVCASKVISEFLRSWNDALPTDKDRDRLLRPLVPLLVDTKASDEVELRRSWMALDWLVRECLPEWLDLAGIDAAKKLRALKPLVGKVELDAGIPIIAEARTKSNAARDAAWAAAGNAARDAAVAAARYAAWAAARYAARYAAGAAAGNAAWAAARDAAVAAAGYAAWAAAGAAAWAAAWAAASKRLAHTVKKLQKSAVALVKRMIACK